MSILSKERPVAPKRDEEVVTFDVPTGSREITDMLPSKMIPYEEGNKVFIRPFTLGEVQDMSVQSSLEGDGSLSDSINRITTAYRKSLSGIIMFDKKGNSLDPSVMTLGDFLFSTFYRKVLSLETEEFSVVLSETGVRSVRPITIDQIEFNDLEAPALPVNIETVEGDVFSFYPVTISQFISFIEEHLDFPDEIALFMLQLDTDNLTTDETEGLFRKFLDISNPADLRSIGEVSDLISHSVKAMNVEVAPVGEDLEILEEEGTEFIDIKLTDASNLVLPFRTSTGSGRSRISFG